MDSPGAQPLEPSFPQALEIANQWLALWEAGELSDEVLADRVSELVASRDGARGFFVVSLAGDSPLMDRLPDPVTLVLRAVGEGVVDLTVRNLAMSSAMALQHRRSGDGTMQAGSERVQTSGWLVVDAFDVMFHLFLAPVRERYALERLWRDAVEVPVGPLLGLAPAKAPRKAKAPAGPKVKAKAPVKRTAAQGATKKPGAKQVGAAKAAKPAKPAKPAKAAKVAKARASRG